MTQATMTAQYLTDCPLCAAPVSVGDTIAKVDGLVDWAHVVCAADRAPTATFVERYCLVRRLDRRSARLVAQKLSVPRTALDGSGRRTHRAHIAVCSDVARHGATKTQFEAAVALVTGRVVTAPVQAQAAPTVDASIVAKVVAAAVAEATRSFEARLVAAEAVAHQTVKEIVVKMTDGTKHSVGRAHRQFEKLLKLVGAGCSVWLAGPAGSGKTTAAEQTAKALGLPFMFNGAIDTEYKLSGFVDAQGRIVSTAFRKAYTEGGVYLFDEVDASLPGALLAFNAALANGHCDFPGVDAPVARHPNFRCIAAGNTWGFGATAEYVGRNKLDAAFLDRFVQLTWTYDEELELALATDTAWCKRVQALRAAAVKRGMRVVISPRATIFGCQLLAAGMTVDEATDATIRAKLSPADWDNLAATAGIR